MGLSESSFSMILRPFECLSHCKVTARSPCCKACCDEGCSCTVDTREQDTEVQVNVTSDDQVNLDSTDYFVLKHL